MTSSHTDLPSHTFIKFCQPCVPNSVLLSFVYVFFCFKFPSQRLLCKHKQIKTQRTTTTKHGLKWKGGTVSSAGSGHWSLVGEMKASRLYNADFISKKHWAYQLTLCVLFFRVYCPRNCRQANPQYARVIGSRVYSDVSMLTYAVPNICKDLNIHAHLDVHACPTQSHGIVSEQLYIFSEYLIINEYLHKYACIIIYFYYFIACLSCISDP